MAMYANTQWTRVNSGQSQPIWRVLQVIWDEAGNVVLDETGKPVLGVLKISPPVAGQQGPGGTGQPPIPVVFP